MTYNELVKVKTDAWHGPRTEEEFSAVLAVLDSGEYVKYPAYSKSGPSKFSFQYDLSSGVRKFAIRTKGPSIFDSFDYKGRKFNEYINLACVDVLPAGKTYKDWLN
jgi:hypothetical protein